MINILSRYCIIYILHNSNLLIYIYQYAHSDFMINQIIQDCCDCLVLPWKYRGQFVPAEVGRQKKNNLDMQRDPSSCTMTPRSVISR